MQKEIKIFGKALTLTLRNDGDFAVANELFLDRQYQVCESVIRSAKTCVLDVGGHLGFFSLMAATINPSVPIFLFEPHEGNFALLKENLKQNHVRTVIPRRLAVSDHVGEAQLLLSKEDLNHSLVKAIEPTDAVQTVQATTLERIFEKNRLTSCDLLKLDCEGSEFAILPNTSDEVLKKIRHIFLEYHDWTDPTGSDRLMSFLVSKGFKVNKFPNAKMKELGFLWAENLATI